MSVQYKLYRNKLTNGSNQYRAVVQSKGTIDLDGLIERMIKQGSTLTDKDAQAAYLALKIAIKDIIEEGYRINLGLFNIGLSIKGNFADKNDEYDASRHSLEVMMNPGVDLRQASSQIRLTKQESRPNGPNPEHYFNPNNGESNDTLTPGGMGKLTGYRLAFDQADPRQGVFLIPGDGTETRVEVYGKNTARELIFMIPAPLTSGDYTLQVRAVFGQESLRTGTYEEKLTVPEAVVV